MENGLGVVEMGHEIRSRQNRVRPGVAVNQVKDDGASTKVVEMRMAGGFWIGFGRKADIVDRRTVGDE